MVVFLKRKKGGKKPCLMCFIKAILPKIEIVIFMGVNGLYLFLQGCFTCPNLEWKQLLQ